MVKMALLEKNISFEVVNTKPSQEDEVLQKSPMGKVPYLESKDGTMSETSVIFEYLEDLGEGQSLYPTDPYEKAKVREIMKEIELYIELPARTCYPQAFFGGTVSEEVKDKARVNLKKGIACLKRNGKFSPYIAGENFTYADIMFMYSIGLAAKSAKSVLDFDLLEDFPEVKVLTAKISERESAQKILADQKKSA